MKVKIIIMKKLMKRLVNNFKLRARLRSVIGDAMFFDTELLLMYEVGLYNINAMFLGGEGLFEVEEIFDSSEVDKSLCKCVRRTEYYLKKYNPDYATSLGGNDESE